MNKNEIVTILEGSPDERELAALRICQTRRSDALIGLWQYMESADSGVRELIVKIAGVLGGAEYGKKLELLSKKDPEVNVRIAAIIAQQHLGRITYDRLSDEIKKFHHESAVEEEPESPERKQEQTVQKEKERTSPVVKHAGAEIVSKSENDRPEGPGIKNLFTLRILFVACIVVVAGIGIYILFNTDNDEGPGGRRLAGSAAIAMMIKERIEAVNKFKSMYLDPENPASRFPMTLELRSFPGETYGDLFERVYGNTTGTETGMNTLGAFWRHMNF